MVVIVHSSYYVTDNPGQFPSKDTVAGLIFRGITFLKFRVPMFFVISGYCIAASCDKLRSRPRNIQEYFTRRIRRIFPPFWIMLAVVTVAFLFLAWTGHAGAYQDAVHPIMRPDGLTPWQWLGNLTLTEKWRAPLAGVEWWRTLYLNHAWTLCYEEQFYLICGLALFAWPRQIFRVFAAITACVAALFLVHSVRPLPIDGFFFDGRWLVFAAGILVYHRATLIDRPTARRVIDATLVAGLMIGGLLAIKARDETARTVAAEMVAGFGFALVIVLLRRTDRRLAGSRLARPIFWCGAMCYSLYLVHWPIVKLTSHGLYSAGVQGPWPTLLVTIPVCLLLSIAVGWAFHLYVERRFLNAAPALPPEDSTRSPKPVRAVPGLVTS